MNDMTPGEFIDRHMARKRAEQDQEIAEGVEWMRQSAFASVAELWHRINDAADDPSIICGFSDDEKQILRAMAMIGWHEVFERAFPNLSDS